MQVEFLESKPTGREMMLYNSSRGQIKSKKKLTLTCRIEMAGWQRKLGAVGEELVMLVAFIGER